MRDLHWYAILFHALSATGAFVACMVVLFQRNSVQRQRLAVAGAALLVLMEVALVVAISAHVRSISVVRQIVFAALAVLLLYVIWRAFRAVSVVRRGPEDELAILGHLGFVLISLFDGFAIVSALDVHAPAWLVAIIAAGAVAIGVSLIQMRKKSLTSGALARERNVS